MSELTERDKDDICDMLQSYIMGESKVMNKYGLKIEEIEVIAVDGGLERCPTCEHWVEAGELVDEDCTVLEGCENCRSRCEE